MPPFPLEALGGLTGRLATLGLAHALWIGMMAAAAAAIAFQLFPRLPHRGKHGLLVAALGITAVAPFLATTVHRSFASGTQRPARLSIRLAIMRADESQTGALAAEAPGSAQPHRTPQGTAPYFARIRARMLDGFEAIQPYVLLAWLIGVALGSARLMLATFAVRRLIRSALPIGDRGASAPCPPDWIKDRGLTHPAHLRPIQARADGLARELGLSRAPEVRIHPGLSEPCLCGLFQPKILLPGQWEDDPDRTDAILAHELAHVRRLDLPANLAQRVVETALFFHPAAQWLSRSLRRERELCADALAVRLTGDPFSLASALESIARLNASSTARRTPTFGAPLGGENSSLLLPRIQELLGMVPILPARLSLWPWAVIPAAGLLALLGSSLGLAKDPVKPGGDESQPSVTATVPAGPIAKQASEVGRPVEAILRGSDLANSDRQISYEVRFLSSAEPAWKDTVSDRAQPAGRDGRAIAWLLQDSKSTQDILASLRRDPRSSVLQAPKFTSFEGTRGTVSPSSGRDNLAQLRQLTSADSRKSRAITSDIVLGSQVDVSGIVRPASVRMAVDLFETTLIPTQGQKILEGRDPSKEPTGGATETAPGAPALLTRHFQIANDIPEGASLLIYLGHGEGIPGNSQARSEHDAVAKPIAIERFVLITPRAIRLEPESSSTPL